MDKALLRFLILILFLTTSNNIISQQTLNKTILHDGLEREYILYVPEIYDEETPVPLVFNFHGFRSNATEQMFYGNFRPIADKENFIIVHPLGSLNEDGDTYFNAQWNEDGVDDISFTSILIDTISSNWNIDLNRVYSTGMSNGGFMSYTLACELNHKIAAIASVTGTMTRVQVESTCNPQIICPILEIHGDSDIVVPFNGNNWMAPIEDVLDFWNLNIGCDEDPIITELADIDSDDLSTVEHHKYVNCKEGKSLELYKILGGGHTWPGTIFGRSNKDINASEVIWDFFSQHSLNGSTNQFEESNSGKGSHQIFPNPSNGNIFFKGYSQRNKSTLMIYNISGQLLLQKNLTSSYIHLDLQPGIYFAQIKNKEGSIIEKIIIQ